MMGLNTCTRLRAIMARRSRRISSSLLPENMGPQIASIHPRLPLTKSIENRFAASYHGWVVAQRRIIVPEKLDHASPEEARENLRDLVWVNRYFGGYGTLRKIMGQLVRPDDSFSVLDVGAASGDMGAALRRSYPRAKVTSLDYRPVHLALAPH